MPTTIPDFLAELTARGQINQVTDEPALRAHLADPANHPRRAYVGLDPTAPSLTIGNLVGIMHLVRFALAGHRPVIVVGGATGLIGDPSGKSAERTLNTPEVVAANVAGQTRIYHAIWKNAAAMSGRPLGEPPIRNNYDWFKSMSFLDALRDIGKHFSVNMMIQKESVKERLHNRDQGISYTEFSYMILQAYDFYHLHRDEGVTLQMGGSDQWGNIVCGIDLIRRLKVEQFMHKRLHPMHAHSEKLRAAFPSEWEEREEAIRKGDDRLALEIHDKIESLASAIGIIPPLPVLDMTVVPSSTFHQDAFGLTWPLVTKADGGKFGKTESGAIWLTADRTSPYAFYQFWLNTADEDVVKFLKTFTLIPVAEIDDLAARHAANPGERAAQRALARHVTELLHGPAERDHAEAAARALFSGEIASLPEATLREALSSAPSSQHDKSQLGAGVPLLDLLVSTKLAQSKREAKEFLAGGSVLVNGRKAGADDKLTAADLLHGSLIALRRGKKNWHLTIWG